MDIPQEYIVQKFYQYAGYPRFKKLSQTYEAGCPICREGNSWQVKRRCYYVITKNIICCHNCGWYGAPVKWIQEVSGLSVGEILKEAGNFDVIPNMVKDVDIEERVKNKIPVIEHLPTDSINLFDDSQVQFFKDNKCVIDALSLIKKRRLDTAINRPHALYISLTDYIHKNRIIIPFYDKSNNIIFYQTRAIYDIDLKLKPRYLSKVRGERSLFNINQIDTGLEQIFIFEGPIDCFFMRNGIAVAGIQEDSINSFSPLQEKQLFEFNLFKKVWVLDSQWKDTASKKKTASLVESGETVFVWPEKYGKKYKDFNDICIDQKLDCIDTSFVNENSFSGIKARLILTNIN